MRLDRFLEQLHPRLFEGLAPFTPIARWARTDEVGPAMPPTPRARDDMIEREVNRLDAAILAAVTIAAENGAS